MMKDNRYKNFVVTKKFLAICISSRQVHIIIVCSVCSEVPGRTE